MRPRPRPPWPLPQRPIVGYRRDADGHWVAELACGHTHHLRHRPPWEVRPWVLDPKGRAAHLGTLLPCPRCAEGA